MPWWRKILALLGLTEDARVRVRAPGIEVIITGDPDLAKKVLAVVKAEIAHQTSKRRGESVAAPPSPRSLAPPAPQQSAQPARSTRRKSGNSQVVRPSELDEMDSPYAIPDHAPVNDNSETPSEGLSAEPTMNVDGMIESTQDDHDGPEPEATAVDVANPQASALPTLVPPRGSSRLQPRVVQGRRMQGDPTETE